MDKLLLEYPWLNKVVSQSKEHGLDWLLMACLALELSGGDPRCRTLDAEFLAKELGESATDLAISEQWIKIPLAIEGDEAIITSVPNVNIYDRATKWGLFQILGETVIARGIFTGRMINFVDIGANTRAACFLFEEIIRKDGTERDAILYFGADPDRVYTLMEETRKSIRILLDINATEEEELEQA